MANVSFSFLNEHIVASRALELCQAAGHEVIVYLTNER